MLQLNIEKLSFLKSEQHAKINKIGKAISHPIRTKILAQLNDYPKTVTELAKLNKISVKNVLFHLDVLLDSGLVVKKFLPSKKEGVSIYHDYFRGVSLSYDEPSQKDIKTYSQEIEVGMYSEARFDGYLRMATQNDTISVDQNDPYNPVRKNASLIWTSGGMVTYSFGKYFYKKGKIESINFSFEICSEINGFRNDYKSDITLSVNGIKLGVFTSDGDFGDIPGKFNPSFWNRNYSQYGHLLVINITNDGTYINHKLVSNIKIKDLKIEEHSDLKLTIENEIGAKHYGGFNLFGKGFGNYDQDILLIVNYL